MISAAPLPVSDEHEPVRKCWVEPIVNRIEVGEAEAGDGSGPDGGLIS